MDKALELFTQLAEKYEPVVIDSALAAARVEAYSNIVASLSMFIFGTTIVAICYVVRGRLEACNDNEVPRFMLVMAGLGASLFAAIGLFTLADPWIWVTISKPELWIAKQVLGL